MYLKVQLKIPLPDITPGVERIPVYVSHPLWSPRAIYFFNNAHSAKRLLAGTHTKYKQM